MRVLVLENRDAFTPDLVKALEALDAECLVHHAGNLDLEAVQALRPKRILLSPGSLGPKKVKVCEEVVQKLAGEIPILGICQGVQVIASLAGARILSTSKKVEGRTSMVRHDGKGLYEALPNPFTAACSPFVVIDPTHEPHFVELSAWNEDGAVMGLRISGLGVEGVQLHPESFLTESGTDLLFNFLYRSQTW